jgi:hypothetical protein
MKFTAKIICLLQLLFVMNAGAESLDELLAKFNVQARLNRFGESREEIGENLRIIKRWEELQALTSFVNADPVAAAEFALAGNGERFPIVLAAAEAEPLQFVRFWNRISREPSLKDMHVQFVHFGLDLRDGANLYTFAFHHDEPLIEDLLGRLSNLVKDDELVFERVEGIRTGGRKAAHLRYFKEYVRGDGWKAQIPDLRGVVATETGDVSADPRALSGTGGQVPGDSHPAGGPLGPKPVRWPLWLGLVAVLAILVLLIRVFLRGRAS